MIRFLRPSALIVLTATFFALNTGCKSTYYAAWDKLGYAKRDILVDRVKDTRDDQEKAKEQFKTTLERFKDVTNFQGGDLEAKYNKLKGEYDSCSSRAATVSKRIASVNTVANDMFTEWNSELSQYDNPTLRAESKQKLDDTKVRFNQLYAAMKTSEAKMTPVLKAFNDQVLFLKHNLNAQAISSLQTTAAGINDDVTALINEMDKSINESNDFIKQMK